MDDDGYEGPERRVVDRRTDVENLVKAASVEAAQYVAQIHRRRLVVQAFLVALFVSAAISLPVVLITNHDRIATSTANATYNCNQSRRFAAVFRRFLSSDAHLRAGQRALGHRASVQQGLGRIIKPIELTRIQARSDALDEHATRYWRAELLPKLIALAQVNCGAAIR